jgi:hypothetical protein
LISESHLHLSIAYSSGIKGTKPHFLNPTTGIPHFKTLIALNQNVSKNLEGIKQ